MDQAADNIANRYRLQLSASWQRWFDSLSSEQIHFNLPGAFQSPVAIADLISSIPQSIWPGFMLPDTLPIIGNEYGDWICVRTDSDDSFGELIHWYHGGGDWIPIGRSIEEAILHDVVDQFRPVRQQMLRGAAESLAPDHLEHVASRFTQPEFRTWLLSGLQVGQAATSQTSSQAIEKLFAELRGGRYPNALQLMLDHDWAYEATACDLVEEALRSPVAYLATPQALAEQNNDRNALARWLFDIEGSEAPRQKWDVAEQICQSVLAKRDDLGWAFDIHGWCKHRAGEHQTAVDIYYSGRHASSFTDQAVRLGSHWFDQRYGKFTIAQLVSLRDKADLTINTDAYLDTLLNAPERQLLACAQQYWLELGRSQLAAGDYPTAYQSFYRAGWDLGAQRLSDYREILSLLSEAAAQAGWKARHAIALTHLNCMDARFSK